MDPDVAYATLIDEGASLTERADAGQDLLTWLYRGGFMPKAWTGTNDQLRELCQHHRARRPAPLFRNPFDRP